MRDELGNRMKENYENRAKTYLTRRTPVIVRIDGTNHNRDENAAKNILNQGL